MKRSSPISILFLVPLCLASCSRNTPPRTNTSTLEAAGQTRSFKMGIAGFTPRNFPNSSEDDYRDFIEEIPELGEFFGVYTAWDDPLLENQIQLAGQMKGVTPLVIAGFDYTAVGAGYFNTHHDAIIAELLKIAGDYHLEYLGFGGEVNRLASEKSGAVYREFIQLYQDVYDALKNAYPDLKVFTVFQYDTMTGHAYLSGLNLTNQWASLEAFQGRLDLAVFTVYPFLEYQQVSDIPENYFDELKKYVNEPVAISETGWPSENVVVKGQTLIYGSEDMQVDYLNWMVGQCRDIHADILMYSFLYDIHSETVLFNTIGLKNKDGSPKMIFNQWKLLAEEPYRN